MPKVVDKDAMRIRILQAAMQTYQKLGFHAAKMTDIAATAGLAKGTLYLYFNSKETLTNTLVKWIFQQLEQEITSQAETHSLTDYIAQLGKTLDTPEDARLGTRLFFEVMGPGFGSSEVTIEVAAFFERMADYNTKQLQRLIEAGEVASGVDAHAMGRSIAAMLDGMVTHRALFRPEDARYREMMDAALTLVRRGLQS